MKYTGVLATMLLVPSLTLALDSPNTGDSSLILHIWSDATQTGTDGPATSGEAYPSYVIDTGINFSDVVTDLSSAANVSVDLDTIMANGSTNTSLLDAFDQLGTFGTANVFFNLVAMDGQLSGGQIAGDRAVLTSIDGSSPMAGTNIQLNNAVNNADTYFGYVSESDGVEYQFATGGSVSNGDAHALSAYWGDNFGAAWSAMDNAGTVAGGSAASSALDMSTATQTLNMALYTTGGAGGNGEAVTNFYSDLGTTMGQATLDFAAGTLTITPTQVPVPAAVWLFGSAILGLVGFSRRSAEQASA